MLAQMGRDEHQNITPLQGCAENETIEVARLDNATLKGARLYSTQCPCIGNLNGQTFESSKKKNSNVIFRDTS